MKRITLRLEHRHFDIAGAPLLARQHGELLSGVAAPSSPVLHEAEVSHL